MNTLRDRIAGLATNSSLPSFPQFEVDRGLPRKGGKKERNVFPNPIDSFHSCWREGGTFPKLATFEVNSKDVDSEADH